MKKVFPLTVEEVLDMIISGRHKLARELLEEMKEAEKENSMQEVTM